MSALTALFDMTPPLSPLGLCLMWRPELVGLHLAADAVIALAFLAIPVALVVFLRRRRDFGFTPLAALFAAFLIAGAASHLAGIWTLWNPHHAAAGLLKLLAALLALATLAALWLALPRALALPSPQALAREVEFRRDAEARARASESRLTDVFDHLADAVFVTALRPDGGFAYESLNPAFERLFGIRQDELLGRGPRTCLEDEATVALVERRYAEALAGHAPVEYEASCFTRSGFRHWHTVLVPLRGADGQVTRLLGSVRDVTETRRLQADLQETARLATVGSMCAGVAHEMSQPVNVIALWAGNARSALAAGRAEPERLTRTLDVVLDQSRRIGALLERMRELTRESGASGTAGAETETKEAAPDTTAAGSGSAPVAAGAPPFDAAEAVAAATEVAGRQYAISEALEVTLDRPPGALPVLGQRAKLEQALLQLLANAHDAVIERRIRDALAPARILVALRADAATGVVAIAVRDTGGGVPEAIRPHIFDPFFTTKDPGRGTGLGLAIAQGVARSMGGRLETWNEAVGTAAAGAVFCLTLPLASSPATPAPPRHQSERLGSAA
jgi:PAS domain S-box-containing protein